MLTQAAAGGCGGLRGYFQPITREKNFFERIGIGVKRRNRWYFIVYWIDFEI